MAKTFNKNSPLDRLTGSKPSVIPAPSEESPKVIEPKKEHEVKKKVGRPKTKDVKRTCKNINVAIPIILLEKWEEIKIVHGSNLTEYITKLIERDMDSNYEHYKNIADSLKNI